MFPAGALRFGTRRQRRRAKHVADRCGGLLPSRLVRGRYYCGSENAAANVVVIGGAERFVDVLRAPGTLYAADDAGYADMHRPHVPSALRVSGPLEEAETEPKKKTGKESEGPLRENTGALTRTSSCPDTLMLSQKKTPRDVNSVQQPRLTNLQQTRNEHARPTPARRGAAGADEPERSERRRGTSPEPRETNATNASVGMHRRCASFRTRPRPRWR